MNLEQMEAIIARYEIGTFQDIKDLLQATVMIELIKLLRAENAKSNQTEKGN